MPVSCEFCVLSCRGLCEELITRPEVSYRLWCVVVCDLETSRIGAPYIYDISNLRVKNECKYAPFSLHGATAPKRQGLLIVEASRSHCLTHHTR